MFVGSRLQYNYSIKVHTVFSVFTVELELNSNIINLFLKRINVSVLGPSLAEEGHQAETFFSSCVTIKFKKPPLWIQYYCMKYELNSL